MRDKAPVHGAGVLEWVRPLLTPPGPAGGLALPLPQGPAAVGPPPTALHRPPGLTPQRALLESQGCGTQEAWGHRVQEPRWGQADVLVTLSSPSQLGAGGGRGARGR